jgi:hypothetical protein
MRDREEGGGGGKRGGKIRKGRKTPGRDACTPLACCRSSAALSFGGGSPKHNPAMLSCDQSASPITGHGSVPHCFGGARGPPSFGAGAHSPPGMPRSSQSRTPDMLQATCPSPPTVLCGGGGAVHSALFLRLSFCAGSDQSGCWPTGQGFVAQPAAGGPRGPGRPWHGIHSPGGGLPNLTAIPRLTIVPSSSVPTHAGRRAAASCRDYAQICSSP